MTGVVDFSVKKEGQYNNERPDPGFPAFDNRCWADETCPTYGLHLLVIDILAVGVTMRRSCEGIAMLGGQADQRLD